MTEEPQQESVFSRRTVLRGGIIALATGALAGIVHYSKDVPSPTKGDKSTEKAPELSSPEQQLKSIADRTVEQTEFAEILFPVSADQALPDSFIHKEKDLPLLTINPKDPSQVESPNKKSPYTIAKVIQEPLTELFDHAKKDGHIPFVKSGYRDSDTQAFLYNRQVNALMQKGMSKEEARIKASETNASPFHSEHQLGTAVDLFDMHMPNQDYLPGHDEGFDIARREYKKHIWGWIRDHAHEHGFVVSYPTGNEDLYTAKSGSGVKSAEPWHIRYVGKELATQMYEDGYLNPEGNLTLDRVLRKIQEIA